MAVAYIVTFMPLDYRVRNPINFAVALAQAGWRVRTIEIDGIENRCGSIEEDGIKRLLLPLGWEDMPAVLRPIRRLMRYVYFALGMVLLKLRVRPGDLVIANDSWSLFLTALALPLEHVVFYEVEIPNHLPRRAPFFERYLRSFVLRNAHRCVLLISCERHRLRFLSKLYRNPRIMLVLNVQSKREVASTPPSRMLQEKPRILYAGRLNIYTRAPLLFDFVAKNHNRYEFEIFGNPEEDSCREGFERIRKLPGVTCHGFVPRKVLEEAIGRANAAIVMWDPYNSSNFGLRYCAPHKFFEMVAYGIPVVCTPNPPLREWISRYAVGEVIDPVTVDGMAAALDRLLRHGIYEDRIRQCRRAFEEAWNFETQIAPVIENLGQRFSRDPSSLITKANDLRS